MCFNVPWRPIPDASTSKYKPEMNLSLFIAKRIYGQQDVQSKVSRPAIRIATIGVAIGLAVMLITVSVVFGFKHTIRDKVVGFGSHLQVQNVLSSTSANTYTLRKWLIPIIGPSVIVSAIALVDALMHLTDGPTDMNPTLWALLNMLSILYIAAASGLCLKKASKCTNKLHRRCFYIIAIVMLIPLLTLILQAKFYELPITSTVFVLVTLFIHMYRTRQHITVDLTTGLNNTNKLSSYLESITQSQDPAKRLFLLKIEIDNFKARKKKHGKRACVVALQKMATFIREQSVQRGTFIARYGKATFAVIAECSDYAEIEAFANKLITASATSQDLLQGPWPITFSIHWSEYGTSETRTIDKFLEKAESNCIKPATPL